MQIQKMAGIEVTFEYSLEQVKDGKKRDTTVSFNHSKDDPRKLGPIRRISSPPRWKQRNHRNNDQQPPTSDILKISANSIHQALR